MEWLVRDRLVNIPSHKDLVKEILFRRGIPNPMRFLLADPMQIVSPYALHSMMNVVQTIEQAIDSHKKITIFGDYDCDGVMATTILMLSLRELGADVDFYIPDRTEGYGLNLPALEMIRDRGTSLVITCDTGITSTDVIECAKHMFDLEFIVTDHHQYDSDKLPSCPILHAIFTSDPDTCYLSGAGVAFKLASALLEKAGKSYLIKELMPFAAIGIIGDVMDLLGDSRTIVRNGLAAMGAVKNYGLRNLLKVLGIDKNNVTVRDVGFLIAPTINAAGRLMKDHLGESVGAMDVVNMFLDNSRLRTYRTANYLHEINKLRREMTAEWTQKIVEAIEGDPIHEKSKFLVVKHPGVPEGLIGLIAGKLKEKYNKPVLLITDAEDGVWKGSGRSVEGFDMYTELNNLRNFFVKFGGHEMACGFSIVEEHIDLLRSVLNHTTSIQEVAKNYVIDFEIHPRYVTVDLADQLSQMEPFGKGFEKPIFLIQNASVLSAKPLGKDGKHLSLKIEAEGFELECVGWNWMKKWEDLGAPARIDLAFFPQVNEWNGRRKVQLVLENVREAQILATGIA
jgi:single-stranded-DNA-specific exonuclease